MSIALSVCVLFPDRLRRGTTIGRVALTLGIAVLGQTASAQEGGIELFAAETIFDHGMRVSVSHIYKRQGTLFDGTDEVDDPQARTFTEHRVVAGIDYGLRADLSLSALLPYVSKELDSNTGSVDAAGAGDVALLMKYRPYKRDWRRGAFHVAAIGGIELPTGSTTERDGGVRLPPTLQPGLGSWNPFVGASANLDLNRWRFDVHTFYKENTEGAQDFERGDFFSFELDAAYRFLHTKYPGPTASGKLGLQWRTEDKAVLDGVTVANSGLQELRLRPGLSWHPRPSLDVSLSVDLPLYQDYDGRQLGLDYRTFLAIGIRF